MDDDKDTKNSKVPVIKKLRKKASCLEKLSYSVSNGVGEVFYRVGFTVASNPWKTIVSCWMVVFLCCLGFFFFHNEKDPLKLWVPRGSQFLDDTEWIMKTFEEGTRIQSVLITADNVLTPEVLKKMANITNEVHNFAVYNEAKELIDWKTVCFKIPIIADFTTSKRKRRRKTRENTFEDEFFKDDSEDPLPGNRTKKEKHPFNPSVDLDPKFYCSIINHLPIGCMHENLLELWKFNENEIDMLSTENIIDKLNKTKISPVTGHDMEYVHLLGGIERDADGRIVKAKALLSLWMLYVNFSDVNSDKIGNVAGTEDWATENTMLWEKIFLNTMKELKVEHETDDFKMYFFAGRSYGDISAEAMFSDMDKLAIGVIIMFIYMQIVLSKFSWTEIRIMLASLGLLSVGMAYISGCGICSFLGIKYGPVHTSLPFLLMGLGVDDVFVMLACWRKVQIESSDKNLPEKIGLMLKHAGASISVTSLTDTIAFLVGGTTILPSLQSFCLYAAANVLMMYVFVVTFFVAILTLDERRISANRNAFIPCIVHPESHTKLWCEKNLMNRFINFFYSKFLLTKYGKLGVILFVIALTGFSIDNVFKLKQKFDPVWFIPEESYLYKYTMKARALYPDKGYEAGIYMGNMNYSKDFTKIMALSDQLENRTDIMHSLESWAKPFHEFVRVHYYIDIMETELSDDLWKTYLSKFLYSNAGGKYQANFKFNQKLQCGQPTGNITVASFNFKFKTFYDREQYLPAKKAVEELIKEANFTEGRHFVWAKVFGNWITDEIIDEEIFRNIGLALIGVMGCTIVLIVNLQVCFWIFICVLLTLINVGGFMQQWGLTLDLVSCIALQLAVGLCVDFAAHIGHTFLTISNLNRNKRALETVSYIGAAVLYGGGSTILAISMLASSESYTYRTFFRIFFLIIVFGLFHGLVLLPVILSIIGPQPYNYSEDLLQNSISDKENGNSTKLIYSKTIRNRSNSQGEQTLEQISFIHNDNSGDKSAVFDA